MQAGSRKLDGCEGEMLLWIWGQVRLCPMLCWSRSSTQEWVSTSGNACQFKLNWSRSQSIYYLLYGLVLCPIPEAAYVWDITLIQGTVSKGAESVQQSMATANSWIPPLAKAHLHLQSRRQVTHLRCVPNSLCGTQSGVPGSDEWYSVGLYSLRIQYLL